MIAIGLSLPAEVAAFSNLFVFGDSVVDTGNVQALAQSAGQDPTPAELGYFEGRFSNGINAADVVNHAIEGMFLAGSITPAMGDNFAFGGARARTDIDLIPDLGAQISAYFLTLPIDPDALYLINAGGNDVRDIVLEDLDGTQRELRINQATDAVSSAVIALQAAGANHIVVVGVADIGAIPEIVSLDPAASAAGTRASVDLNESIVAALPGGVHFVDTIGLFEAVAADPQSFGLPPGIDQTTACLDSVVLDPGGPPTCNDFAFFDSVHPTTAIHQILGEEILMTVPEPDTAGACLAVLLGLRAARKIGSGPCRMVSRRGLHVRARGGSRREL